MLSETTKAALYLAQYYGGKTSLMSTIIKIFSKEEIEETLGLLETYNIIKPVGESNERCIDNYELVCSLETFSLLDILNATGGAISFNSATLEEFDGNSYRMTGNLNRFNQVVRRYLATFPVSDL